MTDIAVPFDDVGVRCGWILAAARKRGYSALGTTAPGEAQPSLLRIASYPVVISPPESVTAAWKTVSTAPYKMRNR